MRHIDIVANYFRTAQRRLRNDLLVSVIGILGLSVAIGCCIILYLFVQHEWSFDDFHEQEDRIYRIVTTKTTESNTKTQSAASPAPLAEALESEFPAVEHTVRLTPSTTDVTAQNQSSERKILFSDSSILDVFSFDVVAGGGPLLQPGSAVITESVAREYFGDRNPIGENIDVVIRDVARSYTIGAVLKTPPATSSISFEILLPYVDVKYAFAPGPLRSFAMQSWGIPQARTFIKTSGSNVESVRSSLASFVQANYGDEAKNIALSLQPLNEVHFTPEIRDALHPARPPMYTYILGLLTVLILGIACANYVILSIGRATRRKTEVGIRKALGAQASDIGVQFWGESLLSTVAALIFGVGLAALVLPSFNTLFDIPLQLQLADGSLLLALLVTTLVVSIIAGGYPTLTYSRLPFQTVLSGKGSSGQQSTAARTLVVAQFTAAALLITGVFTMSGQLDHLLEKDVGFDDQSTLILNMGNVGENVLSAFQTELRGISGVEHTGGALTVLGAPLSTEFVTPNLTYNGYINFVDSSFAESIGLTIVSGRDFSSRRSDENAVVVNQAFVRKAGWDTPVGQTVRASDEEAFANIINGRRIVGVVEDYHYESLHHTIRPLMLLPNGSISKSSQSLAVRVKTENVGNTLSNIESVWKGMIPDAPFQYQFADQVISEQYAAEQRWTTVVSYGATAAILIACSGLFGLALLSAQQRKKEIGIRKVLGATQSSILALMLKDFGTLVMLATVLALPLGFVGIRIWTQNFSYPAPLSPLPFFYAFLLTAGIALVTVGYVSIRSAKTDPVMTIRQE
jgi:putative ABC transport system permease protein